MSWGMVASVGVGLLSSGMGSKKTQNTQAQMDPRMVPYIFGDGKQKGLMQYNSDQLARSQSPEQQAMWTGMMNRGQQLMGGSIAGNPFSAGYKGGTDFGPVGGGMAGNGMPQYAPPQLQPPQQQQPPQSSGPTLDEIMAEIGRRQQQQQQENQGYPGGAF